MTEWSVSRTSHLPLKSWTSLIIAMELDPKTNNSNGIQCLLHPFTPCVEFMVLWGGAGCQDASEWSISAPTLRALMNQIKITNTISWMLDGWTRIFWGQNGEFEINGITGKQKWLGRFCLIYPVQSRFSYLNPSFVKQIQFLFICDNFRFKILDGWIRATVAEEVRDFEQKGSSSHS